MSEQTIGQRRVRVSFNPYKDSLVDKINGYTAILIDMAEELKKSDDPEMSRCAAIAQTHYEDAVHWAVKAATSHLIK